MKPRPQQTDWQEVWSLFVTGGISLLGAIAATILILALLEP